MDGPYGDLILDARDVCNNCFSRIRVERVDPVMSRSGFRHELDAHYSRDNQRTTVDFHDSEPEPMHARGTFCECGVEGSYERLWDPTDIGRERFKDLLKAAVVTLERKDVSFRRREAMRYALRHFSDHHDADRALADGIEAGIVSQVAADD